MADEEDAIRLGISSLQATYLARLRPQVTELTALAKTIIGGLYGPEEIEGVRSRAHRIAGTAATFGFAELGDVALRVDESLLHSPAPLTSAQIILIADLLQTARQAAGEAQAQSRTAE